MRVHCPYCPQEKIASGSRLCVRTGRYRRKSDCRSVQRYRCKICRRYFSTSTFHPCYRQNKRQFNHRIFVLLASGVSQRRLAKILHLSRTTIERKFVFIGQQARQKFEAKNSQYSPAQIVEFDDLETFEHSKCKPISVTLAVEHKSRRILDFEVSRMPAKGLLTRLAMKKYGPRRDDRKRGREKLFRRLQPLVDQEALFKSDQNPHYPEDVKRFFPQASHAAYKGQRGSIVGQGELKKVRFDPIFSLNHTCAMFRANMNRLFRKTWCTTKIAERLTLHIAIYAFYHNSQLINSS